MFPFPVRLGRLLAASAFLFLSAASVFAQSSSNSQLARAAKKGLGLATNKPGWTQKLVEARVAWSYSWGPDVPYDQPAGIEFVPMIWGSRHSNQDSLFRRLAAEFKEGKFTALLGFNEPDGKDQANISVATALAAWPKLESVGARLGSPAGVHPDVPWMADFMKAAKKDKLRVDFVTIHWYGGAGQAADFLSYVARIHRLYNKPVWITEFCPADWGASAEHPSRYSPQQIAQFMKTVVPALKRLPYVERFAWFSADKSSAKLGNGALFEDDGTLTELGRIYAEL